MKLFTTLFIIILFFGCNPATEKNENQSKPEIALKLADAVMHRYDSLIYYQKDEPKFEYDFAFLGYAIGKLGEYNQKYADYERAYIDYFVQDDGTIKGYKMSDYNIDRVRPGFNILNLYEETGEEKYKKAAETLVTQMDNQPRTESGGFWHKKRYPYQMWLDGIYMASPFLARYAKDFDKPEYSNEVVSQINMIYRKTRNPESGLVYHAWDESKQQRWCNPETGQSKHFWSRATGWYLMAMVDVLDYLPENQIGRDSIITILQDLSSSLLKVRDPETGLWYQVLDQGGREGNYLEASGSAMFIYAFAKGAKKGYLEKKYLDIAESSFDSLVKNLVITDDDGYLTLTQTCGACGLGGNPYREGDYQYYISEKKVDNDSKGVAPLILASIELGK